MRPQFLGLISAVILGVIVLVPGRMYSTIEAVNLQTTTRITRVPEYPYGLFFVLVFMVLAFVIVRRGIH